MADDDTGRGALRALASRPGMRTLILPTAMLFAGGIAYGSIPAANKYAIEAGFPFIAFAFWQVLFAGVALLILAALRSDLPKLSLAHLRLYALLAVIGVLAPLLVFVSVAEKLPPGVVMLVLTLNPTTTYLFAYVMRVESFRWLSVAAIAFGFAGVLLIVLPEGSLPAPGMAIWVVFARLAPLAASVNNVFAASLRPPQTTSLSLAAGLMLTSALFMLPIVLIMHGPYLITAAEPVGQWSAVWAAAAQAITYVCFFEIVRRAGPVFFAQLNYVVVAAGLIWARLLFHEVLSLWVWGALALMVGGLLLANAGTAQAQRLAVKRDQN